MRPCHLQEKTVRLLTCARTQPGPQSQPLRKSAAHTGATCNLGQELCSHRHVLKANDVRRSQFRHLKCCLLKYPKLCFKASWSFCSVFVLALPHWLRLPLLLLRELFRLCAQTHECLFHPELPPWWGNKSPTSILHGVQATRFSTLLVHHCWEPSEGQEPLFTDVLPLPSSPKAPSASEIFWSWCASPPHTCV